MEKMQETFTTHLEELKKKQTEENSTLKGINSRITKAEEWIHDLEDRMVEISAAEQNIEKRMKRKKRQPIPTSVPRAFPPKTGPQSVSSTDSCCPV